MKAACINTDQALEICSGGNTIATIPIPLSYGLWQEAPRVELKLNKGVQTFRIQTSTRELKRGIALRLFACVTSLVIPRRQCQMFAVRTSAL